MSFQKILNKALSEWQLTLIMLLATGYGLAFCFREIRSEMLGSFAMLLLGIIMGVQAFEHASKVPPLRSWPGKALAWLFMAIGILALLYPALMNSFVGSHFAMTMFFAAVLCWFCGHRRFIWMFAPVIVFILIIPLREQLLLFISFPLRMSSTFISVELLRLFNVPVSCDLTTIHLQGADIAITDACSGIQQFEAMVLVAYILVQLWHRGFSWKVIHYLFIIPAIIFANSVRIMLIILLYRMVGEVILSNFWHLTLGYVQLILALAIIYAAGLFLPELSEPAANDE